MKRFIRMLLPAVFLALMLRPAVSTTLHVPETFATIQAAIDSSQNGDTVLVAPGEYFENIDFHGKGIVVASHFITENDTSFISQTIINGNRDSSTVSIENREPEGTELVGFSITNGLGTGDWPYVRGGGVHISSNAKPTIRYCYIFNNECEGRSNRGAGIYLNTPTAWIRNCRIYNNTSQSGAGIMIGNGANGSYVDSCEVFSNNGRGITITYSKNVFISRTLIKNNLSWGLRNYQTDNVHIDHCTIVGNGEYGLFHTTNNNDTLYINNSVLFGNGIDSIGVDADTTVIATYSIIESGRDKVYFQEGCLDTIPLFADTTSYRPAAGSPVIDAGDPSSPRDPDSTIADMGVHYFPQATAIYEQDAGRIQSFHLEQNYPNPFNPITTISYQLPVLSSVEGPALSGGEGSAVSDVQLTVYNVLGQKIQTLVNEKQPTGQYRVTFTASGLASGVYFYRLEAGGHTAIRKMILLR